MFTNMGLIVRLKNAPGRAVKDSGTLADGSPAPLRVPGDGRGQSSKFRTRSLKLDAHATSGFGASLDFGSWSLVLCRSRSCRRQNLHECIKPPFPRPPM